MLPLLDALNDAFHHVDLAWVGLLEWKKNLNVIKPQKRLRNFPVRLYQPVPAILLDDFSLLDPGTFAFLLLWFLRFV